MNKSTIRCLVVNYNSPWEMLSRCLRSVAGSEGVACKITLIDNASKDGVPGRVWSEFPNIQVIELDANLGFAAAVNRGLREAGEPFVLLLNTDAVLEKDALTKMLAALDEAGDDCAGVAPKMLSSAHQGIIDAIGTVMPPDGASFNRGIGQCDLGQYDCREEVFGLCFGAALLRRQLFEPDAVGPLYEGYFLYFEDSDWCMRARSQGYRFLTAPESVVYHLHSGTIRHEVLPFRYKLIELNTLRIVVRNFENPLQIAEIVAKRCLRLVARTVIRRKFVKANVSTLFSFAAELPRLIKERKELKRRRIVSDAKVFKLAEGEDAFFDTVTYRPDRNLDSLIASYSKLFQLKKRAKTGELLAELYLLRQANISGAGFDPTQKAKNLFARQPDCVKELLDLAGHRGSN